MASTLAKVVLKASEHSVIPALPHDAHPLQLRPDATYVLVGGLGGLGRGLAIYLADHGAKHFAFFSRTADIPPAAQKVLDQLKERNVEAKGLCLRRYRSRGLEKGRCPNWQ